MKTRFYYALIACLCVLFIGVDAQALTLPSPYLSGEGMFSFDGTSWTGSCIGNIGVGGGGGNFGPNSACNGWTGNVASFMAANSYSPSECDTSPDPACNSWTYPKACCIQIMSYYGSPSGNTDWIQFYWGGGDTFSLSSVPPSPSITITSPTSGTTITSNTTNIVGTYQNLDIGPLGWGYLHIEMKNPNTGIYSNVFTQAISGASGSFSFAISDFSIIENGTWDMLAKQELDANTFVDLTPTYNLIFNVSGNSNPYTFSDWNTWYSANGWCLGSPCTPTDFGNSMANFIAPIFTNVYEFANNTLTYFNATTAHDKGYAIGSVFPTAQAYLDNIDVFFGGFPLVPVFEFAMIILLGIFIVRTIFKFIPFFG